MTETHILRNIDLNKLEYYDEHFVKIKEIELPFNVKTGEIFSNRYFLFCKNDKKVVFWDEYTKKIKKEYRWWSDDFPVTDFEIVGISYTGNSFFLFLQKLTSPSQYKIFGFKFFLDRSRPIYYNEWIYAVYSPHIKNSFFYDGEYICGILHLNISDLNMSLCFFSEDGTLIGSLELEDFGIPYDAIPSFSKKTNLIYISKIFNDQSKLQLYTKKAEIFDERIFPQKTDYYNLFASIFYPAEKKFFYFLKSHQPLHKYSENFNLNLTMEKSSQASATIHCFPELSLKFLDAVSICADEYYPPRPIFRGLIQNIKKDTEPLKFSIQIVDDIEMFHRIVVAELYNQQTFADIILDLFQKYYPSQEDFKIDPTVSAISISFIYVTLFEALKKLAEITGYSFFFDNFHVFHFVNPKEWEISEKQITEMNTIKRSLSLDNRYEDIYNYLYACNLDKKDEITENHQADGIRQTFILAQTPIEGTISAKLNGDTLRVGIWGRDNFVDKDILVRIETRAVLFSNPPLAGKIFNITYKYNLPFLFIFQNTESIQKWGRIEKVERIPEIEEYDIILQKLLLMLQKHSILHRKLKMESLIFLLDELAKKVLINFPKLEIYNEFMSLVDINFSYERKIAKQTISIESIDYELEDFLESLDKRIAALEKNVRPEILKIYRLTELGENLQIVDETVHSEITTFLIIDVGQIGVHQIS